MNKETEELIKKEVRDFLLENHCQHQEFDTIRSDYDSDYKEGFGGVRRFYKCRLCGKEWSSHYPRHYTIKERANK